MKVIFRKALLFGSGFFLFLMLLAPTLCWSTLPEKSSGKLEFIIDHGAFWRNDSTVYLDIYYKIAYTQLQFLKSKDGYQARFDLSVVIYRTENGAQVIGKHWQYPIRVKNLDQVSTSFAYSQVSFQMEPDQYKVKVKIEDLNARVKGAVEREVEIRPFPQHGFDLGMVQFAETIVPDSVESAFTKHGLMVTPNPTRSFGENISELKFYAELYQSAPVRTSYSVDYRITSEAIDSVLVKKSQMITSDQSVIPLTGLFDIEKMAGGKYRLTIKVSDPESGAEISGDHHFTIAWSPVAWGANYEETVHQILYLATAEEMKAFKKLKDAPEDHRIQFMIQFWAQRDPVPSTPQNEFMIEHFRRFKYANENFGDVIEGWRTDMGRIYIKFGEPDEIERYPFNFDSRPYEIWNYYACGFRFVFVDEDGYGRYNLVYPASEDMYSKDCYGDY